MPVALLALASAGCGVEVVRGDPSEGLVCVRIVGDSNEIVRLRVADGAARPLTHTPDRDESWPYWSQAAGRLVFQAMPAGARGARAVSDLVLWDPETGETPLTRTPGRDERWPAWSADGARIAYAFQGGRPAGGIAISEPGGGATVVVAASGPRDFYLRPAFAPQGDRLVAQRRGPDGRGSHLWVAAPGAEPRPLTGDPAWFDSKAWFTRDGARLVYSRRPSGGGPHEIAILDVAEAAAQPPTRPDAPHAAPQPPSPPAAPRALFGADAADDHSAKPSPTRDEIAFVSDRDGSFDLFLIDLGGGPPRNLTRTKETDELAPRWSPDGQRIAVTSAPTRGGLPRLVDRESLLATRVVVLDREGRVLLDAEGMMPDWMPAW